MDKLDAVLIQPVNNHVNTVLRINGIAGFRQPVKTFDNKSAERVVFVRIQAKAQTAVKFVQIDRTFNDIFPFIDLLYKIFLIFIIFIMYFTDNLFQDIFQGD